MPQIPTQNSAKFFKVIVNLFASGQFPEPSSDSFDCFVQFTFVLWGENLMESSESLESLLSILSGLGFHFTPHTMPVTV